MPENEEVTKGECYLSGDQLGPLVMDVMQFLGPRTSGPTEAALILSACLAFLRESYGVEVTEFKAIREPMGNA